jgi:hypothetical protein
MSRAVLFACAFVLAVASSRAFAADWGPWPSPKDSPFVSAGFAHDDGGALVVMCDTKKRLIAIWIMEPRASWQKAIRCRCRQEPTTVRK